MLAAKSSAGVASEMNPRNPLTQAKKSTFVLKPRADVIRSKELRRCERSVARQTFSARSPETEVSVAPQKGPRSDSFNVHISFHWDLPDYLWKKYQRLNKAGFIIFGSFSSNFYMICKSD